MKSTYQIMHVISQPQPHRQWDIHDSQMEKVIYSMGPRAGSALHWRMAHLDSWPHPQQAWCSVDRRAQRSAGRASLSSWPSFTGRGFASGTYSIFILSSDMSIAIGYIPAFLHYLHSLPGGGSPTVCSDPSFDWLKVELSESHYLSPISARFGGVSIHVTNSSN